MALTATFAADFTQFDQSLKKATVTMKTFDNATKSAARDLKREMESISGQKVAVEAARMAEAIERIGGASKLTQAELRRMGPVFAEAVAKAKALGEQAPAGIVKLNNEMARLTKTTTGFSAALGPIQRQLIGFFSVAAATSAVRSFTQFGSVITDLSAKTGISTSGVQRLKLAFDQSGVSIDTVTAAVNKLGRQLVTADKASEKAFKQVGLNAKELIALEPDQAFLKVADAVGKIQNPMERVTAAQAIFGKQGAELLPGLNGHLAETVAQYERMGLVLSSDVIKAADDFGDSFGILQTAGMAFLGQVLAPMLPGLTELAKLLGGLAATAIPNLQKGFNDLIATGLRAQVWLFDFAAGAAELSTKIPSLRNAMGESAKDVKFFREQSQIAKDTLAAFTAEGVEPAKAAVQKFTPVLGEWGAAADAAADAFKKAVEAMSGVTAFAEAEKAIKQIAAAGGALKVIPSQLKQLSQMFDEAAKSAIALGRVELAAKYRQWADALSPVTQIQQRWNVTIGDFVTLNPSYTDAIREQTSLFEKQADEIAFGVLPNLLTLEELFKRIGNVGFKTPVFEELPKQKGPSIFGEMGKELADIFKDIPMTLVRAFEGGGDWIGAFKSIGSRIGATLGKALGETIGKSIGGVFGKAFGPIGEALGALVGPLIGKLHDAFTVSASEDVMRRVGKDWGVSISEGLADQIAETAKTLFKGDRLSAEVFHFGDILEAAGGLNELNFDKFIGKFRDVFVLFQEGKLSLQQTQKVLNDNFATFAKVITDSGKIATKEFLEIIRLNKQLGTESKAIADFVKEQATRAGSALATAFEGASSAEEFERLGVLALGAFNAAIDAGLSMQQALAAVGPSLDKLVKGFADLGIEADAALQPLLVAHQVAETTAGAAAGALNEAILALSNFGALNDQTLDALEGQLGTIFSRVQAEVAKVGGTHADALRQIVPFLQQALRASQEFGLALDPATRELIDQARELGILGEAAESETDIMKDGFEDVVHAVKDLERALRGLPPIIRDIGNAAGDIEFPTFDRNRPGTPGGPPIDIPFPIPTDPTRPQSSFLGGRVSSLVNTGGAQALTLMPVFVHGQASASEIERAMTSQLPVALATGQPRAAVTTLARLAAEEAIARGR